MIYLVCYDIRTEGKADHRRLRRVAKLLETHGVRVQKSVFEITMNPARFRYVREAALALIDRERDSLIIYEIIGAKEANLEFHGARGRDDLFPELIV